MRPGATRRPPPDPRESRPTGSVDDQAPCRLGPYVMNDWVAATIAFLLSLAAFHYATKLVARVTGRTRGGLANVRSTIAFMALMVGGAVIVSALLPAGTPLIYVAYGVVGGVASLVSQLLFGSPAGNTAQPFNGSQGKPHS